ncbi:hypothetical protein [uncultured Rubinisphaera sp.]|uniref:hypothetical protein n=1 Tax=uncultured Rubinisphaera sp. TaxID=1678686 RepID=UPI0030D8F643
MRQNATILTFSMLALFGLSQAAEAGVGWIDNIYNNTDETWYFRSVDSQNNGKVGDQEMNGGGWITLKPNTKYHAEWCAIPWFYQGKHYKSFSLDKAKIVNFYTTENGGKNWIEFENDKTGETIARQQIPDNDFHAKMIIDETGPRFELTNNQYSTENTLREVLKEGMWVAETYINYLQAVGSVLGAIK